MRIAIIGAGGVGGYYGGLLARAGHDVRAVARGEHLAAIRERCLEVRTPDGSWLATIAASDQAEELAADFGADDLAVVAVKTYSLDEVAPAAAAFARRGATVLPLLNGVDAAERLAALGVPADRILGGLTYISAARIAPGVVERRSPFQRVTVGELAGGVSPRAERVAAALGEAGVETKVVDDVALVLWQKFVFIASMAAVCGLARAPIGALRATALGRRLVERAVREAVAVGRARGVALPADEESRVLALLESLPPAMRPSLLLDLEAGGRTEVDDLSGAVARFAAEAGIETPVHDTAAVALAGRALGAV